MNNSPFESYIFGALDTVPSDRKKMFSMTETGHFPHSFSVVDILVLNFLDCETQHQSYCSWMRMLSVWLDFQLMV